MFDNVISIKSRKKIETLNTFVRFAVVDAMENQYEVDIVINNLEKYLAENPKKYMIRKNGNIAERKLAKALEGRKIGEEHKIQGDDVTRIGWLGMEVWLNSFIDVKKGIGELKRCISSKELPGIEVTHNGEAINGYKIIEMGKTKINDEAGSVVLDICPKK